MSGHSFRLLSAQVSHAAAAVISRVAVEQLPPEAVERNANAIPVPRHGSEIAHHQNRVFGLLAFAQQRNHARSRVVTIYPLEACWIVIELVQGRFGAIEAVQLLHPVLHAFVNAKLQDVPLQAHVVSPFAHLPELISHEEQLLTRLRKHVAEEQTQVGKLLPLISRHFADQ